MVELDSEQHKAGFKNGMLSEGATGIPFGSRTVPEGVMRAARIP
jgi:hypothetical protein